MQKVQLVQYLDVRYKVQILYTVQHVLTRGRLFTHQDAGCTVLTMMQGCLLTKMQDVQYSP